VQYGTNSLPNQIIQHNFISIYCDDLMSIVKAFAIYVRENSSRMSCNAKVYKFQKLGFEILETQETLLKKHELKLIYANNIIQNQEDHNIPELSHLTDCGLKYSVLNEPSFFNIKYKTKNTI